MLRRRAVAALPQCDHLSIYGIYLPRKTVDVHAGPPFLLVQNRKNLGPCVIAKDFTYHVEVSRTTIPGGSEEGHMSTRWSIIA